MGSGSPGLLETAAACAEQQLEAFTPPQLAKVRPGYYKEAQFEDPPFAADLPVQDVPCVVQLSKWI